MLFPHPVLASETLEATVIEVLEERTIESAGEFQQPRLYQKLKLEVTKGSLVGEALEIESGHVPVINLPQYLVGDRVLVSCEVNSENMQTCFITEYLRRGALIWLFIIFVLVSVLVARGWGGASLLGMVFSFLVIFLLILPQISKGSNPLLVTVLGSFLIIPVSFYLSHGVNKKTSVAVVSTLAALIITGILGVVFVDFARLTGFSSDEAAFLQTATQGVVNIKGLVLAGIMIGALGVLDDITIAQSSVVFNLKEVNPRLNSKRLFWRAMKVGRDHISSMVNTLVLVYAGASLPLLLLFTDSGRMLSEVVNYEIIAEEIVRTLVGSIGLILAVPITTFLAVILADREA